MLRYFDNVIKRARRESVENVISNPNPVFFVLKDTTLWPKVGELYVFSKDTEANADTYALVLDNILVSLVQHDHVRSLVEEVSIDQLSEVAQQRLGCFGFWPSGIRQDDLFA